MKANQKEIQNRTEMFAKEGFGPIWTPFYLPVGIQHKQNVISDLQKN